jgi:hypothetical protein
MRVNPSHGKVAGVLALVTAMSGGAYAAAAHVPAEDLHGLQQQSPVRLVGPVHHGAGLMPSRVGPHRRRWRNRHRLRRDGRVVVEVRQQRRVDRGVAVHRQVERRTSERRQASSTARGYVPIIIGLHQQAHLPQATSCRTAFKVPSRTGRSKPEELRSSRRDGITPCAAPRSRQSHPWIKAKLCRVR